MPKFRSIAKDPEIRHAIFVRDTGICGVCGLPVDPQKFHIDHVIPRSRGGVDDVQNLQVSHPRCNISKGNGTPDQPRSGGGRGKLSFTENRQKYQMCFVVETNIVEKLDLIAKNQCRFRSQQLAWMIDESYAKLFPNGGQTQS